MEKSIYLWEPKRLGGVCVGVLEGHTAGVRVLVTLPDGRLASGSLDATVSTAGSEYVLIVYTILTT